MDPLSIAGGVLSLGKAAFGLFQNAKANDINPVYTPYQVSQYAKDQLGTAQQMFNGRMAGASSEERNINAAQSDTQASVDRNATSSAQALAMATAGQGQADAGFNNLQVKEEQNKYGMLSNLNNAYATMTREGDKVYQDKLNKYQMDVAAKNGLRSSAMNNIFGGASDALSFGIMGNKGGTTPSDGPAMRYSPPTAQRINTDPSFNGMQLWYPQTNN